MAQGLTALLPTNGVPSTTEELREILEYQKIVQFRDVVLAGAHPRVKIPSHLVGKQINSTRNVSSPSLSTPRANPIPKSTHSASGSFYEDSSPYVQNRSPSNFRTASTGHVPMSSKSEINPILLEKSEDLIKAEMQLQRQRLERALREQIEQQRLATKALAQTSESLPSFDLSEVLSKALTIVHPSTTVECEPSVDAHSSVSDSFDENTFYSSQHDTPEPFSSPQRQKEVVETQSHDLVSGTERPVNAPFANSPPDHDVVITGAALVPNDNFIISKQPLHGQKPPLPLNHQPRSAGLQERSLETENSESSSSKSAHAGNTADVGSQEKEVRTIAQIDAQMLTEQRLQQAFADKTASPLIRAHNLSPIAPQPARVSPLATAREAPILREAQHPEEPPPAQVAALRQNPSGVSSADSSPQGAKGSDKRKTKKEKKKKRKASSNENADTPDSPYIKPEPRSPSPFPLVPLARPSKRQRQYAVGLNYDEARYEPAQVIQERAPERYKQIAAPRAYERFEERYEPEVRRQEPNYHPLNREEGDHHRISGENYERRPKSPATYALPYTQGDVRPVRAASRAIIERRIHEEPLNYREPIPRASVRPDEDRERSRSPMIRERRSPIAMGPPRQPVRIVVDAYGREYIDPTPAPSVRQSVAPPVRYRDSDVIYERAPIRTVSARAPVETYEETNIVYRRPSPSIAPPRHVITQPEYAIPEYRSYRQREYSVRPNIIAPPVDEYVETRGPPERRHMSHFEEGPREYAPRAPSVRPEPIRYEIPREYVGRLQTVRPEPRAEMAPQSQREFSIRPSDSVTRREHGIGPEVERYYNEAPSRRPAEVAFIERPRAREASVVVYADDVRREVYR